MYIIKIIIEKIEKALKEYNTMQDQIVSNIFKQLFPICRSITGNGVRETLRILRGITDFEILEVPSGTKCYDWTIPKEWNVINAYVKDQNGVKVIDFQKNNLHLKSYSIPIHKNMCFNELKLHLETLPDMPDAIPYRTTYYKEDWGFCLSQNQYESLDKNSTYEVVIDTSLREGHLTYGQKIIKGESKYEFLISTYCCHPSLANDNLSGMVLWILLLQWIKQKKRKHSYRFIIVPETIGSIAYLAKNETEMKNIFWGFILTCVAGPSNFEYKKSFQGNHFMDSLILKKLKESKSDYKVHDFDINGSDERQYSSPFFRIPIGTICKSKYYEYDYYHTSKDNLEFIKSESLIKVLDMYISIIEDIEKNEKFPDENISNLKKNTSKKQVLSLMPYCEPMFSKRNLYPTSGGKIKQRGFDMKKDHHDRTYDGIKEKQITGKQLDVMRWILFYSDGMFSLEQIANKIKITYDELLVVANELISHNLIRLSNEENK